MSRHDERMELHSRLIDVLVVATSAHPRDFDAERQSVMDAANLWALSHAGCYTVNAFDVDLCDVRATGHVDWISKFPLYVSERVYGMVVPS